MRNFILENKKWEAVCKEKFEDGISVTLRLSVEGGCLYKTIVVCQESFQLSTCFVPISKCISCNDPLVYQCYTCKPEKVDG